MAKLFLTLAVLCVFGTVMVEGLDINILKDFVPQINACKAETGAKDGKKKQIHFLINNRNKM